MTGRSDDDFREVYLEAYRSVVAAAWSVTRDRRTAEEHAQEAFARAYPRWRRLRSGGYAVPWVHRVAVNLAIDEVRRRRNGDRGGPGVERSHEATVTDAVTVAGALARLPRRQREAVVLSVIADLSEAEVAAAMRVSTGSVKTHKSRGLAALRSGLAELEELHHG